MSLADTQYSFRKRLTGAAHFFQEGVGPASFNSNRVEPGYARVRLLFCMLLRSLLAHFSWGKTITTANDRHTVFIFKCVDSSMVLHCIMCKYRSIVMQVRENRSMTPLNFVQRRASPDRASVDVRHLNLTSP